MMMPSLPEMMMILLALVFLFGAKKLPSLGASLGKGIRNFKKSVSGAEHDTDSLEEKIS